VRGDDGRYHLFAATFTKGCDIDQWYTNSFITHAVSRTPLGPYAYADTVRGVFSHGPVVAAHGGTVALVHVGCGLPQAGPQADCRNGSTAVGAAPRLKRAVAVWPQPHAAAVAVPACAVREGTAYQMDGFDTLYTMPTARLGAAGARWLDHGQVL
jgi:hypothetical protein